MSGLEKAQIIIEIGKKKREFVKVLFNPNEYTIQSSNKNNSINVPGKMAPVVSYASGEERTLSMELFFDTYNKGSDVRDHTNKISRILHIESELHEPPICVFSWGKFQFRGHLESVTEKFTMFLSSGTPVRATLSISIREYISVSEQNKIMSLESADRSKQFILKEKEQLWMVADKEYDDPSKWREIADLNKISNPLKLKSGTTIIVPRLD